MSSIYPPYGSAPVQLCQRCGRPLPPNEVYCSTCGLVNTPSQVNNAPAQSPSGMSWGGSPSGTGQPGGQPWRQSPAQPPPNNAFDGLSAPQQAFGAPNQFLAGNSNTYGAPGLQSSPTNFFGAPVSQQPYYPQTTPPPSANGFQQGNINSFQNAGFAQAPTTNGYQQPGFTTPPAMNSYQSGEFAQHAEERPRRPKIVLIITMVIILLSVVAGSIGGYVYLKNHSTTATIQVLPTTAPTSIPQGKPLFSDPLINNNAGWDLTSKPGEFSVKIVNGSMVLEDDNNKLFSELIPGGKNFKDFFLTTDVILSKGTQNNGYGIYIRGASNQNFDIATYYRFEIYGDGSFAIYKGSVDGTGTSTSSFLVNYSQAAAIQKQGKMNHIAISAKGSTMTFIVNGQTLKIITDNTYSSGSIAFFVSNLPHTTPGAQATFSNIAVYPPQP
jgi:Domain of Unknown Function (DUF1080)